ncbi:hypothetical protein OIU78_005107 [Salix suchowensis]|nr:hypothetical protein OIU78_005107 [Salix suchowensis]
MSPLLTSLMAGRIRLSFNRSAFLNFLPPAPVFVCEILVQSATLLQMSVKRSPPFQYGVVLMYKYHVCLTVRVAIGFESSI